MSSTDEDDPTSIRVDQFLPHPPGKVWRALTDPELIAQWLMPGDFRLEIGHRYTMRAQPVAATGFSGAVQAEVLAFEVEKLLRIGWRDAAPVEGRLASIGRSPGPCIRKATVPGSSSCTKASTLMIRSSSGPARS
ncbi:MAG TPA: SRPBCC domain-containing protein [Kribbella sp.]